MATHLRTQIGRLSGGQRRRVFLARALAAEPDLFLLDEPVTGIDPTTQELLMDLLEAQADRGKTIVATTHDLATAAQRFQQVLAVNRTVVAYGPAKILLDADVLAARVRRPPAPARRADASSSTTPTTTTTPPPASATSTSGAADGPHPRAAGHDDLHPRARRVRAGRRSCARSWARTSCCAGSRSSATPSPTPGSRASSPRTCSASRSTSARRSRPSPRRSPSAG